MKAAPTSCGFDPKMFRELKQQLAEGSAVAVFHKPTGRVLYPSLDELKEMDAADYRVLPVSADPK